VLLANRISRSSGAKRVSILRGSIDISSTEERSAYTALIYSANFRDRTLAGKAKPFRISGGQAALEEASPSNPITFKLYPIG